jgi:ketosteroid isomerase-like protein
MPSLTPLFAQIYSAFNARDIEAILPHLHPEVTWANGQFGGYVHGRDAVRKYWTDQFEVWRTQLEPLDEKRDDAGRHLIKVHITITDPAGNLIAEKTIGQAFTVRDGLITRFDILEDV